MNFKVYYANGDTYVGAIEATPIWEVLLIVERDKDHGRKIVSGGDYYTYQKNGKWHAVDFIGMVQYMARPYMEKRFLVGVMSYNNDDWNNTMRLARNDKDFPIQTALHGYEITDEFD